MTENYNKNRIVKNSLLLYVRMLFTMWINLWATRLVLVNLGVEDYGIMGVVGSTVTMFAVLTGGLTNAINRFLAFELGKEGGDVNKVFCNCINIVTLLSVVTLLLLESVGLWFLNNKLQIPEAKTNVAFWLFQFSTIGCMVNILSIPYNALIIAKEKMGAFAYISIIQVVLNFLSIYVLKYIDGNRLFWYSLMLLGVAVLFRLINQLYCRIKFRESKYHFCHSPEIVKSIGKFMGVSMIDGIVNVIYGQGCIFIINIAYGVYINGIYAIAAQVKTYVQTFSQNIQKAIEPQIIKNYAAHDDGHFNQLINKGSVFQMILSMLVMIPLLIRTQQILSLWLGTVPDHLCHFVRIVVFISLIYAVTCPIITGALATGKIKKFLMICDGIYAASLAVFYIVSLKCGISIDWLVIGFVLVELIIAVYRAYCLSVISNFRALAFVKHSFLPCLTVGIVSYLAMWYLNKCVPNSTLGLLCFVGISCILTAAMAYRFCFSKTERESLKILVITTLKNKLK